MGAAQRATSWVVGVALVLLPLGVESQQPPHDASNNIACNACHAIHGSGSLLPRGVAQEAMCKSCHNPTGLASTMTEVSNHVTGPAGVVDCGACHDPHRPHVSTDPHLGGQTAPNLRLIRTDIGKYVGNQALEPAIFQSRPTHFAFFTPPFNGICQTCHSSTDHFSNEEADQGHASEGTDCTTCHKHQSGFQHGGGGGTSCGDATSCHGTRGSHPAHVNGTVVLGCDACHDISALPAFADGRPLQVTTVCDACHSPFGTYDGVDHPRYGAKANWDTGVYQGNSLAQGKERWCATCHDEEPAAILGVPAPNVIGDEEAATYYGMGYGYYKTGHGLPPIAPYPASGATVYGAGLGCDACHDPQTPHIDGLARTYEHTAPVGADNDYQHGYRLRSVNDARPLILPRTNTCGDTGVIADHFRLCFSCHVSEPFTNAASTATNFLRTSVTGPDVNAHYAHLEVMAVCGPGPMFSSDWSFSGWDSRASCVTCHNVHGSTQLSMVRDGRLVGTAHGLEVVYYNAGVTYSCATGPAPRNVTLSESTGTVWHINALDTDGFCATCHGGCGFDAMYERLPINTVLPRIALVYGNVGSDSLLVVFSEGVYANADASGDLVESDFVLTDDDDGRWIDWVEHVAGDQTARLHLNAPLDEIDDVGADAVAAATAAAIYDASGNELTTASVFITGDPRPPTIGNMDPSPGATDIPCGRDPSFTLSDDGSGIDWATLSVTLIGDLGYSETYTGADAAVVSRSGSPATYIVTVNPDVDFGIEEIITVTVNVDDRSGNSLTPPAWSFTTAGTPQTLTLRPSGLNAQTGGWTTFPVDTWATSLDSHDGDASYAVLCCTSPGWTFLVEMDDPVGLAGTTIQSITFHVHARYRNSPSPGGTAAPGSTSIGYATGTNTVWEPSYTTDATGDYNLVSSIIHTTDSDGGTLDLTDINNLRIAVQRGSSGSMELRVTEVYAEITYTP